MRDRIKQRRLRTHRERIVQHGSDREKMRTYVNLMPFQDLLCNPARRAERRSQASGKMPAPAHIRSTVPLDKRGIIRVGRARIHCKIVIISGPCIRVGNPDTNRKAVGFPVQNSGYKFRNIRFLSRSGKRIPPALTPFHKPHHLIKINGLTGRKSLNQRTDPGSVGLTKNRNAQPFTKAGCHSTAPFTINHKSTN